jgi:site-specific DNA-methyltransferase (adenine-specific)
MIINGDCLEEMAKLEENSVDAIVTDPPYGIGFMNKDWDTMDFSQFGTTGFKTWNITDKTQFGVAGEEGEHDLKVIKNFKVLPRLVTPGAQFQQFSQDWATQALRVLKPGGHLLAACGTRTYHRMVCGIQDAGFEIRDTICWIFGSGFPKNVNIFKHLEKNGILDEKSDGLGTALKPACEFFVLARKPLSEKTIAANWLKWGTGCLSIDDCRVGDEIVSIHNAPTGTFAGGPEGRGSDTSSYKNSVGRWPANLIHDGSEEVEEVFPNSASRFFYCSKASKAERNAGVANNHPTVKPLKLIEYLVKLISQPGQLVLDPFAGSGTTGLACARLGREYLLIESDAHYCDIIVARLAIEENKK